MTTKLQVDKITRDTDIEELVEIESKDKLWFDELFERMCLKHYTWDKDKFVEMLSSKHISGFVCKERIPGRTAVRLGGFLIFYMHNVNPDTMLGVIEVVNMAGLTSEHKTELAAETYASCKRTKDVEYLRYTARETDTAALRIWGDLLKAHSKDKPQLIREAFSDEDGYLFEFKFNKKPLKQKKYDEEDDGMLGV